MTEMADMQEKKPRTKKQKQKPSINESPGEQHGAVVLPCAASAVNPAAVAPVGARDPVATVQDPSHIQLDGATHSEGDAGPLHCNDAPDTLPSESEAAPYNTEIEAVQRSDADDLRGAVQCLQSQAELKDEEIAKLQKVCPSLWSLQHSTVPAVNTAANIAPLPKGAKYCYTEPDLGCLQRIKHWDMFVWCGQLCFLVAAAARESCINATHGMYRR